MSLDVYLSMPVVCPHCGGTISTDSIGVYDGNITHNLAPMAAKAGVYDAMWRPDEHGLKLAGQLIEPLKAGLEALRANPAEFRELNPANGWGDYDGLVRFVTNYLAACEANPHATVSVSA